MKSHGQLQIIFTGKREYQKRTNHFSFMCIGFKEKYHLEDAFYLALKSSHSALILNQIPIPS